MRTMRSRDILGAPRTRALALSLLVAGAVALALPTGLARAATILDHDPTPTPSPTAGPPPSFAITGPLFGAGKNQPEGPIGTYVQVKANGGSGWTPNASISLSLLPEGSTCGSPGAIPVSPVQGISVGGDSSFSGTFVWPPAASPTPTDAYIVCAAESGAGAQVGKSQNFFLVLANGAPSINVEPLSVTPGGKVTVTGSNFLPSGPVQLWLQHPGNTFKQDPGDGITTNNLASDSNGNFNATVTLPVDRTSGTNVIVATIGDTYYPDSGYYPVWAASQPLSFIAATPTPGVTPSPSPTAVGGGTPGTGTTSGGSGTPETFLIGLLGAIAVVLLVAGVVVAVLALRGRTTPPGADAAQPGRPSGDFGGYGGYLGDGPLDQTVADPQWGGRAWEDDDRWQSPPGRPWSGGRASSPYDARTAPPPPSRSPLDDEDDDRYRTRMGDPYSPPPPSRPNYPPQSRPMGPPQSRPMPPRSNPRPANPDQNGTWNGNDTQDTGPAPWPPRQ